MHFRKRIIEWKHNRMDSQEIKYKRRDEENNAKSVVINDLLMNRNTMECPKYPSRYLQVHSYELYYIEYGTIISR